MMNGFPINRPGTSGEPPETGNRDEVVRQAVSPVLNKAGVMLANKRVSATAVTLVGLGFTIFGALMVACGQLVVGGAIIGIGGAIDLLDGAVARARGPKPHGALLDSVCDRIGESVVLVAMAIIATQDHGSLGAAIAVGALAGCWLVSYIAAIASPLRLTQGPLGRAGRVIVVVAALVLSQVFIGLIILLLGSVVTVVRRIYALVQASN